MEENPGAGNVLLRTLATILAQRLRQINPRVFGLSTYAVVDSPELPETPSEPEDTIEEPSAETSLDTIEEPVPVTEPTEVTESSSAKKSAKKTQLITNPDELEPL